MHREINRVIVESSIVFVSIFATIGLLIGASQNQFKFTYIYLGYMLYYSLPFILSCSFGVVSMLSENENSQSARATSWIATSFFLTGLIMLVFLASSAAQTSMLPTTFLFMMPYFSVPLTEFLVFGIVFGTSVVSAYLMSEKRGAWRFHNLVLTLSSCFFIMGIIVIMIFGTTQLTFIAAANTVSLARNVSLTGSPEYPMSSVNFTLDSSDQIQVKINSVDNQDFSYVFLEGNNYLLYNDSKTRPQADLLETGYYNSNFSFTNIIGASSIYYLVFQASYVSTNVTFSVQVLRTDSSIKFGALLFSVFSLSVLAGTTLSRPSFYGQALTLSRDKQRRSRTWH